MFDRIFAGLGDAAADVAADAFNAAMKTIWVFATRLLSGALSVVDKYTRPDLSETGPLAGLLPTAMWLGSVVVVLLGFVQTGRAVARGGHGFGRLAIGLAQYVAASVAGLAVLEGMVAASDELAHKILDKGLGVDNWAGLNSENGPLQNAVNSVNGVGLGLIALLCVIPAALGFLIEALIRSAGILVLAATIPIVAAGLINETTRRWFWLALRWAIALTVAPPAVAFTVVIGLRIAKGAAHGSQPFDPSRPFENAAHSAVTAVIAGGVLIVALTTPLAIFKMFAFVEPNSVSGSTKRDSFAASGASHGGRGSSGSSEAGAESDTDSRFGRVLAMLPMGARGHELASHASGTLDQLGAGHPGGPVTPDSDTPAARKHPGKSGDFGHGRRSGDGSEPGGDAARPTALPAPLSGPNAAPPSGGAGGGSAGGGAKPAGGRAAAAVKRG